MKTIQEQIEVMQHFAKGEKVEYFDGTRWDKKITDVFDWKNIDYRIKEPKKTITIEKWLMKAGDKKSFFVTDGDKSYFENYYTSNEKVKLLETYKVEL